VTIFSMTGVSKIAAMIFRSAALGAVFELDLEDALEQPNLTHVCGPAMRAVRLRRGSRRYTAPSSPAGTTFARSTAVVRQHVMEPDDLQARA
jgi:hypothetical protein